MHVPRHLTSLLLIMLCFACADAGGPSNGGEAADLMFAQDGDLYSVTLAAGATPHRIATGLTGPSWSPDGTMLAALRSDDPPAIVLLRPDGSDVHQLTGLDWTCCTMSGATWSPDGQALTYLVRAILSTQHLPDIYSINVDGTDEKLIEAQLYDGLQWSPDATRYTLTAIPTGIVMVKLDGTARFDLAKGRNVDWSPDGATIAYSGDDGAIHLITPEGTNIRALPAPSTGQSDLVPKWSPDGSKIAFATYDPSATFPTQIIGVMNADGSGPIALATAIQRTSSVDWSSDGAHLAFSGYASS